MSERTVGDLRIEQLESKIAALEAQALAKAASYETERIKVQLACDEHARALEASLKEARNRVEELEGYIESRNEALKTAELALEAAQKQGGDLERESRKATETEARLRYEVNRLTSDKSVLEASKAELESLNNTEHKRSDELGQKVHDLEAKLTKAEDKLRLGNPSPAHGFKRRRLSPGQEERLNRHFRVRGFPETSEGPNIDWTSRPPLARQEAPQAQKHSDEQAARDQSSRNADDTSMGVGNEPPDMDPDEDLCLY